MVTSKEDDSRGDDAIRPPLPRRVRSAFQQIIQIFVLRSKTLSLMTRKKELSKSSSTDSQLLERISKKIDELQRLEEKAMNQTPSHLDDAKKDIFLSGNTSGGIERYQPQPAGAELLLLALICERQSSLFDTDLRHPENIINLYKGYTSKLHFQAHQLPQKRVFLDIHNLEEELDSMHTLLGHQEICLERFATCISAETLRLSTMTRVAQFKVESLYKDSQLRQLRARIQEIENMKTRSRHLKEQVKQTIEILEEDHGKAIRVFTIVTLFFLPLSFVSSFLGMNTTDVRNTSHSQWLFWATGIPVTIFVLALAYIYGYRGDEIRDWRIRLPHRLRSKIRRPVSSEADGGEDGIYMEEGKPRRSNGTIEERQSAEQQMGRKKTFDSLKPFSSK